MLVTMGTGLNKKRPTVWRPSVSMFAFLLAKASKRKVSYPYQNVQTSYSFS